MEPSRKWTSIIWVAFFCLFVSFGDATVKTAEPNSFIHAEFYQNDPETSVILEWNNITTLSVTVRLKLSSGEFSFSRNVKTPPSKSSTVQEMLGNLDRFGYSAGDEFRLNLYAETSLPIQLSWLSTDESVPLLEIREGLNSLAHLPFVKASAAFAWGSEMLGNSRIHDAIRIFEWGIDRLGKSYVCPTFIDDTDMKKILADHKRNTDRMSEAATLYSRVLETRLELYAKQHQP